MSFEQFSLSVTDADPPHWYINRGRQPHNPFSAPLEGAAFARTLCESVSCRPSEDFGNYEFSKKMFSINILPDNSTGK